MSATNKLLLVAMSACCGILALAQDASSAQPAAGAAATVATPRLANGKPDLSGYWVDAKAAAAMSFLAAGPGTPTGGDVLIEMPARDGRLENFENDSYIYQKSVDNMPVYKPEFWAKVCDLDYRGNHTDPTFNCKPAGVPRAGAPARIVSLANEVIFFHTTLSGHVFRFIPIDRPRNKAQTLIETWNGVPEARWEGDTLVIESIGFNDENWLGWGGYFHSFDLKVTGRVRREGNTLHYEAVAEDPTVLQEPYRLAPMTFVLNPNPNATIAEADPCSERDAEHIQDNIRG